MLAIASLLVVFTLSVLFVRIGSHALNMTGLSMEVARFQALSALSGAGFTTSESESAVDTAARRKVVTLLIRAGSLGIVTAISSLVIGFVGDEQAGDATGVIGGLAWQKWALLFGGLAAIYALSQSEAFDRVLTRLIRRNLSKYTELDLRDYAHLLHLAGDYRISELDVKPDSYLADRTLADLMLNEEGVLVLGVDCEGEYYGAPAGDVVLKTGFTVTLYGRHERLSELAQRTRGDRDAHADAVAEQDAVNADEREGFEHRAAQAGDGKLTQ